MTIVTNKSLREAQNNVLLLLHYVADMYEKQMDTISWHDQVFTENEYKFVDTTNNKIENANKNVKSEFRKNGFLFKFIFDPTYFPANVL